jgi:hypothetical protein
MAEPEVRRSPVCKMIEHNSLTKIDVDVIYAVCRGDACRYSSRVQGISPPLKQETDYICQE